MRIFKYKPLSYEMAAQLNLILKVLKEKCSDNSASRSVILINIQTSNFSIEYLKILLNILDEDNLVTRHQTLELNPFITFEANTYYNITNKGVKYLRKGGYKYKYKHQETYIERMERRREVNDNFTYYRNYIWLGGIIVGAALSHRYVIEFWNWLTK